MKAKTITDHPFPRNYSRELLLLERGSGVYLQDAEGNEYLDFGAGIAVNALGYGRKDLAETAARQMADLIHVSNLYATAPAVECGRKLLATGPFAAVHFGNSGAEANEAAMKYARLYARAKRGSGHHKLLSFDHGFHGRTFGSLSITPKAKYREPFEPLVPGTEVLPYNDPGKLAGILDGSFAAVFVEVVQGEGGLSVMTEEFAAALNSLCRKHDVILVADEVQTGLGRTGYVFASEMVGLEPDIVTLSKPLAGGLPLSATLIPAKINDLLEVGQHGTTFGGGPVTTAVASKVLDILLDPAFLTRVRAKGAHLGRLIDGLASEFTDVGETKGAGLLRGFPYRGGPVSEIVAGARDNGLLVLSSGDDIVRIAPPLVIENEQLEEGIRILSKTLKRKGAH